MVPAKRAATPNADVHLPPARAARLAGLRYVNDGEPGIQRLRVGSDFRYVLPNGRPLKSKRTLNRITKLAIPPAYENVWICPDSRGHIQAVGRDARGRKQYRYHRSWRELRDKHKFDRMIDFALTLPQLRAQVSRDLAAEGLSKDKVVAAAIRLLDTTALRVGNDEYVRANGSFGLTTLRNRHADVKGSRIVLHFRGKGGKVHEVDYKDKRIARVVARCQEFPGYRLFEYMSDQGKPERVTSTDVNEYLRKHTGGEFTAKDFRTWHGSLEFAIAGRQLASSSDSNGSSSNVKDALAKVAQRLGNTPAICRKCYVHPALVEALAAHRLPHFQGSANGRAVLRLRPEERALQRFLKRQARAETRNGAL